MTLLLSVLGASAPPAMAATDYPVDEAATCRMQYNGPQYFAGSYILQGSSAWTCYSPSFGLPLAFTATPVGGIDMQKYCSTTHPGSKAVVPVAWRPMQWACR
jgi:hypothetical protein